VSPLEDEPLSYTGFEWRHEVRVFGALFLVVLLALAVSLYLRSESAKASFEAVRSVAADLREEGVEGRSFDRRAAARMVSELGDLIEFPDQIPDRVEDLRSFAATAASWAESAPSPSAELTVSVALRAAAAELRGHALRPSPNHLQKARRRLDEARAALAGEELRNDPTSAVRDRLENLQRSQEDRQLALDEELAW
jgi:hypothetical protein